MAQSMFQDMVNKKGLAERFYIDSAATSREEIGNGPHYGTISKLRSVGIPVIPHRARQMTRSDYDSYDYLIGMDSYNISNLMIRYSSALSLQEATGALQIPGIRITSMKLTTTLRKA